jgi:hypothetical protein
MTNAIQTSLQFPEIILPNDLREWIDKYSLARLVLASVQDGTLLAAHIAEVAGRNADWQPRVLLGLLTYCYAAGIYSSTEIELSFTQDMLVRHLCADIYPEAHQSRWFRRDNRQSIQRSLTEVLHQAWRIRCRLEESGPDATAAITDPSFEPGVDGPEAFLFAAEAQERINRAVRLDCWEFDC